MPAIFVLTVGGFAAAKKKGETSTANRNSPAFSARTERLRIPALGTIGNDDANCASEGGRRCPG